MAVAGRSPAGKCPRCGEGRALPTRADGDRLRCRNCGQTFKRGRVRL